MKLAFDLGGNMGQSTDVLLQNYDKVICFEPNPHLVKHLKNKYHNNNRVIIEEIGLSDEESVKKFYISNSHVVSTISQDWITNSRFTNVYNWDNEIEINTTTLNKVIEKYGVPYFIKIDVEGYEYEVFMGLTKLLDDTYISFEWAEEQYSKINETVSYLKSLGYSNFSYTYGDTIINLENISWDSWENLSLHDDINVSRKEKWGMIYLKK